MRSPRAGLFVSLLLAVGCDAGLPDRGGDERVASAVPRADIGDQDPPEDEVPTARDDAPSVIVEPAADVGAPADAPADTPTAVSPAAVGNEPAAAPAQSWFIKGSVTSQDAAAAAGASVRVSLLSDAGALTLVGDAKVDLDGTFSVAVPASIDVDLGIAQLLDVSGGVVGSVLLGGAKGSLGAVLDLAPFSAETSLEVDVLLAATRCACATAPKPSAISLALDVSALVDADLSLAVDAALDVGADLKTITSGLAAAVIAGARARAQALADLDVKLDAKVMLGAQLDALGKLGRGLRDVAAGKATAVDVLADVSLALDAALSLAGGLETDLRLRTQLAGTVAFSSSLSAAFSVDSRLDVAAFAGIHAAAALDAKLISHAVVDLLEKADANAADVQFAVDAGLKLQAEVAVALDVEALLDARRTFVATLRRGRQAGGLIGGLLTGAVNLVGGLLDPVLDAVLSVSIDVDASLTLDLDL